MKGITIFMEGGGPGSAGAQIRRGMDGFLASARDAARMKRIRWKLVPCGSRANTFARFREAVVQAPESMVHILLVDSEAAVKNEDPRTHLRHQDGWDPAGVPVEAIQLMVQIMETWIVADPKALAQYYGKGFAEAKLPRRTNLEEEPKKRILHTPKDATKSTGKGAYHKIRHAGSLLGRIDAATVRSRCPRCERFFNELDRIIERA